MCNNRINLLVWFTKHRQLARQVGDSRALLFVEKEAMAPRTAGELTGGMAHGGHIRRKNYEFISVKRPAPAFAYSHGLAFHHGNLDPMIYDGHTHRTALRGSILELTREGGQQPFLPPMVDTLVEQPTAAASKSTP